LQALVGGGEEPAPPPVDASRQAARLGGTNVAGPPGVVQTTAPSAAPPNRLAYGTDLPGVTIGLPTNGMAPPAATQTAAAPAQAQPQAASPQTQPPPAPSRAIQREPLLSNNLTASQQDAARRAIRAGTPLATVQAHVEQWKQENVAARHQDAVDAAAEQEANYQRRQKAEQTAYDRTEKAKADEIAAAQEKRAADKAAAEAADILKDKEENARTERTLLTIGPKVRAGIQLTPEEDAEYSLRWNKYRAGPIQEIPDGKGGFFKANVPREMPPQFPPPPGQTVAPGPQAIPGTERQPEMAPATVVGGMLANGIGQRKIMTALAGLEAHPDAVGLKANAPNWLLQRTDPEGESLRAAVSNVGGHEFHELSGAAVQMSEAKRLKYIPSDTDSATTLKTKLHQMLDDNRAALLQSYRTYGPEGNFRRSVAIEEAIIDSIPQVSIDSLKAKPETARDFDKAFGKGAAKLVLEHD